MPTRAGYDIAYDVRSQQEAYDLVPIFREKWSRVRITSSRIKIQPNECERYLVALKHTLSRNSDLPKPTGCSVVLLPIGDLQKNRYEADQGHLLSVSIVGCRIYWAVNFLMSPIESSFDRENSDDELAAGQSLVQRLIRE